MDCSWHQSMAKGKKNNKVGIITKIFYCQVKMSTATLGDRVNLGLLHPTYNFLRKFLYTMYLASIFSTFDSDTLETM